MVVRSGHATPMVVFKDMTVETSKRVFLEMHLKRGYLEKEVKEYMETLSYMWYCQMSFCDNPLCTVRHPE